MIHTAFFVYLPSNMLLSQLNDTIDDRYLTGISLTHGIPGIKRHIWSFVAAWSEQFVGVQAGIWP